MQNLYVPKPKNYLGKVRTFQVAEVYSFSSTANAKVEGLIEVMIFFTSIIKELCMKQARYGKVHY